MCGTCGSLCTLRETMRKQSVPASSPILSPGVVGIQVSIALHHTRVILITDPHGQLTPGREDRQEQIGLDVEAAIGDTTMIRCDPGSRRR